MLRLAKHANKRMAHHKTLPAKKKTMNARDAIKTAKEYFKDVYADEDITNVGLEEVEYHEEKSFWSITLGFSRPWNSTRIQSRAKEVLEQLNAVSPLKRSYKVITINSFGIPISMKNRETAASE